jgi:catechol 2,3-dioxygenase-like lactoylglutathione lyase family enzyme
VETGGDKAIANGRGGAHVHFALRIPHGSIDRIQLELEEQGYEIERVEFDDGNRSLYINDPDGNLVELMDAVVDWAGNAIRPVRVTV